MSNNTKRGTEAVVYAEYRLLNALLKDSKFLNDSRIHKDLFVHEVAKSIYKAMDDLHQAGIPITEASLFQAANELDFNVGLPVVKAIYEIDSGGAIILDDILKTLEESVRKKSLTEKFEALLDVINGGGPLDTDSIMQRLFEVDMVVKTASNQSLLKDFEVWSNEYIAELEDRAKGKKYTYGDDNLDAHIFKGAYPGAITLIAASTGQGKSTFVLNMINNLINLYVPCMYVSLEMSGVDTYDRLIARRRDIPMSDLHACDESLYSVIDLVKEEKRALQTNKKFYFVEDPSISIAKLRALIKEFKQRSKADYALVAVDLVTQLKEFMNPKTGMSVAGSMEQAMNELNALAKEQNVHIVAVAQFNREADNYKLATIDDLEMCRPGLNHVKNSHAPAERSRVVLSLFRRKYYADRYLTHIPEATDIPDILEVQILKNSSGPAGAIFKYFFEGPTFKITPLLDSEDPTTQEEIDY